MLVLSVLNNGEMYGYQIIKELETLSDSTFKLNEGTLYPILHSLENEKYLESKWEDTDSMRKRKYYRITKKGEEELRERTAEWKVFSFAVGKVLEGKNA